MEEILPGVYDWTTRHERFDADVHSHYLTSDDGGVIIDPRVPEEGIEWFRQHGEPQGVLLTNRHHYRHSGQFAEAYGCPVHCHEAGLHEFTKGERVEPFEHGDEPAGGFRAIEVGVLCPEETAFHVDREGGIVMLGDCAVQWGGRDLVFVPDEHLGDDPAAVKRGVRDSLRRLIDEFEFRHLLLAHGEPFVGSGKDALQKFVKGT
ncbi:MAG: hypothetical protein H0W36_05610 [Gemmatimonadetes bacterium]|nr:hypothetical protein [Gemmatimonadota bacterium]